MRGLIALLMVSTVSAKAVDLAHHVEVVGKLMLVFSSGDTVERVYLTRLTDDASKDLSPLFRALRMTESGRSRSPYWAVSDHGQSIGPYLISYRFYLEAMDKKSPRGDLTLREALGIIDAHRKRRDEASEKDKEMLALAQGWLQARNARRAEGILFRYWRKHCPEAVVERDFFRLVAIFKSGGQGLKRDRPWGYWRAVTNVLRGKRFKEELLERKTPVTVYDPSRPAPREEQK